MEHRKKVVRTREQFQCEKDIEWLQSRLGWKRDPWILTQIAKLESKIESLTKQSQQAGA